MRSITKGVVLVIILATTAASCGRPDPTSIQLKTDNRTEVGVPLQLDAHLDYFRNDRGPTEDESQWDRARLE